MESEKIDLFNNDSFNECMKHAKSWEETEGTYYTNILCCKVILSNGKNNKSTIDKSFENIKKFVTNSITDLYDNIESDLCVLPKGHSCKCSNTINIFNKLPETTITKIKTAIYSTPGNDDYIFKNRSNRLFPIKLTDSFQRKIKDKKIKLSCAIPLKDSTTPLMQASAYLDYITFVMSIKEVNEKYITWTDIIPFLLKHKEELINRFKLKNKRLFNDEGFTICPVTGYEITLEDIAKDTRIENGPNDIQLGHCDIRNENSFTIRGFNICLMTREGNRLVGDTSFFDDSWIKKLEVIVKFHNLSI
jgi:hypothetical protein